MPYRSLADFLDELEQAGELVRIGAEVDPEFELAEIADQVARDGGPALLFQNVKGCRPGVAMNLLATESRIRRALGVESLAEMAERLSDTLVGQPTANWFERLKWGRVAGSQRWEPKFARTGLCQQVVRLSGDVDLGALPALRNWPQEPGRFIQAGQLYWLDPESGQRGIAACDLQVHDRTRLALLCDDRLPLLAHLETHRQRSERMPVAIVLGGDPAYRLITCSPLCATIDPLVFGGLLRGQPIELVKCRSADLAVPADADLVIEGYIDPAAPTVTAGPVGAAGGFYRLPQAAPVVQVVAVTERTSPVCPAVVPSRTGGEPQALAHAATRIFLPAVRAVVPELVDFALPDWGGPTQFLLLAIRKTAPFQARRVASAIWGWEPLATMKLLVIVDSDVDVHDPQNVWSRVGSHVHPGRDVFFHVGPGACPDHSAPVPGAGHAMAIDATAKLSGEHPRPWPDATVRDTTICQLVESRWREYGLPSVGRAAELLGR